MELSKHLDLEHFVGTCVRGQREPFANLQDGCYKRHIELKCVVREHKPRASIQNTTSEILEKYENICQSQNVKLKCQQNLAAAVHPTFRNIAPISSKLVPSSSCYPFRWFHGGATARHCRFFQLLRYPVGQLRHFGCCIWRLSAASVGPVASVES